jgi:hypothetical protein
LNTRRSFKPSACLVILTVQGKRLWRDKNGNIVTQKPTVAEAARTPQTSSWPHMYENFLSFQRHEEFGPTPPSSARTLSISSASEPCSPGNFSDHLPMVQSPKEQSAQPFDLGRQWSSPLTSPLTKFDLFFTSNTKHAPFADLLDPHTLSLSNYSLTTLRDCWTLFDTLRRC